MSSVSQQFAEGDSPTNADLPPSVRSVMLLVGLALGVSLIAIGQSPSVSRSANSPMQKHYEAAFRFQKAGNLPKADSEYKVFLGMALHQIANGRANLGEYARAVPMFEEALRLDPGYRSLQMDYAGAALDAGALRKAKSAAISVLDSLKTNSQLPDAHTVSVLAQSLLELGEHQQALEQFKTAVQLHPGFGTSYDLAAAYLFLGDKPNAAKILDEIPSRFGDTATIHLKIGILYGKQKFFEEAIAQFRSAIARDSRLKGAHYSLGASYMMQTGESAYAKAEVEFRKEIGIDSENPLVYAPLGRIALSQHRYADAEADLKRAVQLNPQNAGTFLILGQVHREVGKIHEAEAAFRKAIALTLDPSLNGYEVERAHFWLGRLLIQNGSPADGRKELDISRDLLYLKERQNQSRLAGNAILQAPLEKTHEPNPEDLVAQKTFEKQAAPLISSSYDNLGVDAARAGDFAGATAYFGQAARWNPTLDGVDKNLSYAAFAANEYAEAVGPLSRMLALHPEDAEVRTMLGLSYSMVHDYAQSLRVLRPIEVNLQSNPQMELTYFGSMAIAGDYGQGLARLQTLAEAHPDVAIIHYFIGQSYASKEHYGQAAEELHAALRLDPSSADAKYALALVDVALGDKADALTLFSELAEPGTKEPEVYYQLGMLQIALGSAKAAVGNLETAVSLNTMNANYHQQLAEAYRKNEQLEEGDREQKESERIAARAAPNHESESRAIATGSLPTSTSAAKEK
jgi:tetratricopeptide (TPR) repeat protein